MPDATFVVTVQVSIRREGANVNEILHAVGKARNAFGVQLAEAIIEWEQESVRDRLCSKDRKAKKGLGSHRRKEADGRKCNCRVLVKEGYRGKRRTLTTELGRIGFRVGYVSCKTCRKKFAP